MDVILLGHSLGGIVAADVALLRTDGQTRRKHRILGLINFDVPFLGLHPRVIPTGICASIPRKDPETGAELPGEQEEPLGLNPLSKPAAPSPNFDPPFANDVRRVQRGLFKGMMHFVDKNAGNLSRSIFDRVVSSAKYANCVNNFPELRRRYRRLVELEEAEYSPERVRFVNYYTASTGRISRKAKTKSTEETTNEPTNEPTKEADDINQMENTTTPPLQQCSEAPSISIESEEATSTNNLTLEEQTLKSTNSNSSLTTETPSSTKDHPPEDTTSATSSITNQKDEVQSLSESVSVSISTAESDPNSDPNSDPTQRKLRKFILLPSHHWKGNDNAHWTPILMEDMDEVTAHQSLFIPHGANYDHLVGDTVALIEQWVQSELSRRLVQESLDC